MVSFRFCRFDGNSTLIFLPALTCEQTFTLNPRFTLQSLTRTEMVSVSIKHFVSHSGKNSRLSCHWTFYFLAKGTSIARESQRSLPAILRDNLARVVRKEINATRAKNPRNPLLSRRLVHATPVPPQIAVSPPKVQRNFPPSLVSRNTENRVRFGIWVCDRCLDEREWFITTGRDCKQLKRLNGQLTVQLWRRRFILFETSFARLAAIVGVARV